MNIFREPIARITVSGLPDPMMDKVSTALSKTNFKILEKNISKRLITIGCIVDLFNMVLWRAWGDKVLLHFKPNGENQTDIQIYGIPNLFRLGTDRKERLYSKAEITAELRKIIKNETGS